MKRFSVFSLFLFLCISCNTRYNSDRILAIDVDSCLTSVPVSIFEFIDKIELISLDDTATLSNDAYSGVANITTDGVNFYILDNRRFTINAYAPNGKILYSINRVGRGPGEYTLASQIAYNDKQNLIEILNPLGKILRYSCDSLKYVSELNFLGTPLATHYASHIKDEYFLYSHSDEEQLYLLNEQSKVPVSLGYNTPEHMRNYMSSSTGVFSLNGQPCIFRPYDGRLFYIDTEHSELRTMIKWDFGKYNCKYRDIPKFSNARDYGDFIINYSQNHIAAFCSILGTTDKLFCTIIFRGDLYTLNYNLSDDTYNFFNRTSEGMCFTPELFHGDVMYKFVDYSLLPSYINREILDDTTKKYYDQIISQEGSAIIKYTLRSN